MLLKLHKQHASNPLYIKPQSTIDTRFGIHHFAGDVFYDSNGFLEKNRDTFSADLIDLLHTTKSPFLKEIFSNVKSMVRHTVMFFLLYDSLYIRPLRHARKLQLWVPNLKNL